MSEARAETLIVPAGMGGTRIDRFLASRFESHSRSALQRLIREGLVTLAGAPVKASLELREGDRIDIRFPPPPPDTLVPEPRPLSILYEDDDLLVLDKPAGLVVHPGAGNEAGTLVHALIARAGSLSRVGGAKRPGIVHRLDRGTSGLLIVARTDRAHLALANQFKGREVKKTYIALVWGRMRTREGVIEKAIARDRTDRKKMAAGARGRPAVSRWRVRSELRGFSLLEVRPETGRTHQIRVHLQSAGHPIVGDDRYGGAGWKGAQDPRRRQALKAFRRLGLHAAKLEFRHPTSGKTLTFAAPLPAEFQELIEVLAQ